MRGQEAAAELITIPCFVCRKPIEIGELVAWFDGVEWSPGRAATADLLPHGHSRPAHFACSNDPDALDPDVRAALDAGFMPGGPGSPPKD